MRATQIQSMWCGGQCRIPKIAQKLPAFCFGVRPGVGVVGAACAGAGVTDNTRQRRCTTRSCSSYEFSISAATNTTPIPIMVNGCGGKMGQAVIQAALSARLDILPAALGSAKRSGDTVHVCGKDIELYGPSESQSVLQSLFTQHPHMIVVDHTVPDAVNDNADLYCKVGVPFVMGTTGGDRERLYKTVDDSKVYAVISPQMAKQVLAFLAFLDMMAKEFPAPLSGYSLQVIESHQKAKLDRSGTAEAFISRFKELGASFDSNQIELIRDPEKQKMLGVPEEHLSGHAFHTYRLTSPDGKSTFEFKNNVLGRSFYAEGTVDAILFLANKVQLRAEKRIYDMIDVLREGSMRLCTSK